MENRNEKLAMRNQQKLHVCFHRDERNVGEYNSLLRKIFVVNLVTQKQSARHRSHVEVLYSE